jgi:hypothetical protein
LPFPPERQSRIAAAPLRVGRHRERSREPRRYCSCARAGARSDVEPAPPLDDDQQSARARPALLPCARSVTATATGPRKRVPNRVPNSVETTSRERPGRAITSASQRFPDGREAATEPKVRGSILSGALRKTLLRRGLRGSQAPKPSVRASCRTSVQDQCGPSSELRRRARARGAQRQRGRTGRAGQA